MNLPNGLYRKKALPSLHSPFDCIFLISLLSP
nr:MAG TPA: hypothetical protein [Caudoviricetes sp.]